MRLIITFLMAGASTAMAASAPMPDKLRRNWSKPKRRRTRLTRGRKLSSCSRAALNALEERKGSLERAQQYQQVIDNFPKLSRTLRSQLDNLRDEPKSVPAGMSSDALNPRILQVSSQLLEKTRQAQQEQERAREISDSLNQLPQQQTDARRRVTEVERRHRVR